ncbi:hypothetical protein AKJ16_DCAP07150 [Drosera capensis]
MKKLCKLVVKKNISTSETKDSHASKNKQQVKNINRRPHVPVEKLDSELEFRKDTIEQQTITVGRPMKIIWMQTTAENSR